MRTIVATVLLLGGFATFAQPAPTPESGIPSAMSADSNVERDGVFYAKGHVRIRIGDTTITADEADIRRTSEYRMRDVELRGNVHMSYQLKHD